MSDSSIFLTVITSIFLTENPEGGVPFLVIVYLGRLLLSEIYLVYDKLCYT